MSPNELDSGRDAAATQSVILSQLNLRFEPELCFSIRVVDMDVDPWLLTRKEVESIPALPEYGWTHPAMLYRVRQRYERDRSTWIPRLQQTTTNPKEGVIEMSGHSDGGLSHLVSRLIKGQRF